MGIEYEGTFGLSNQTGGIVYLSVGFEAIYPETIRNDLMLRIINKYESQLNVVDELNIYPSELKINNVYPNPSNNSITISFSVLSQKSPIEINIKTYLANTCIKRISRQYLIISIGPGMALVKMVLTLPRDHISFQYLKKILAKLEKLQYSNDPII